MRTRTVPELLAALALALAAALPGAATAQQFGAHVGLDYGREDRWAFDDSHTRLTRLEYDLGLNGAGHLVSPSMAQWLAAVQWRHLADSNGDIDNTRSFLEYRLRAVLFQDPRSPLRAQLQAARLEEDLKSDTQPGSSQASSTTAGADLMLSAPGRPSLRMGYQYYDRDETGPLLAGADRTVHTLNAATTFGGGTFDFSGLYTGNLSAGTFASDNYDDHRLDLDGQAEIVDGVSARLSDSYYRRVPGTNAATNLSQEFNVLSAVVLGKTGATGQQRVGYSYTHALTTAPSTPDAERAEQRVNYWDHRIFTGTPWQLYTTVDVALSEIRSGTTVERATGELLYLQALWRRQSGDDLFELRGGPQVGARQPEAGDGEFGYGGTVGATAQHRWDRLLGSAAYDVAYESDLYAASGWSLRQFILTTLSSPLGGGVASAQFQAAAARREGGLLGAAASRSLTLQADYRWRRHSVMALGGLQDGVSGALGEPLRGDGLFLPAPFDTQSRYLTVTGTFGLGDHLWLTWKARTSAISMPDRPDQHEDELFASITWSYAGIFLSLEDRYIVDSVGSASGKYNQFIFRIRRGFGTRP